MTATFTLVIETSTPRASLATIGPGGHLEQREFTSDRSHNAVLFAPLQELLDWRGGVETGLVLVGSGPPFPRPPVRPNGSFMGLPQKANSLAPAKALRDGDGARKSKQLTERRTSN